MGKSQDKRAAKGSGAYAKAADNAANRGPLAENNDGYLKEASVPLAVMDAVPVALFCGTSILIGRRWKSPLFRAGAAACTLAGAGKVAWKMILAVNGKDIRPLNDQFRVLMPGGFALMGLALFAGPGRADLGSGLRAALSKAARPPQSACFLAGAAGMTAMAVLGAKMDHSSERANWIEQSVNLAAQAAFFAGTALATRSV